MLRYAGQPRQEREAQRHAAPRERQDGPEWSSVGHTGLLGPQGGRLCCPQSGNKTGSLYTVHVYFVQETGPEIQSVYMTVAADLVLNQVRAINYDIILTL